MSYVGNTPTTQSFIEGTDYFNGDGSTVAFTLSRTVVSPNDIIAVVNNVVQQPNTAYTVSGTTITFTSAPSAGSSNVYVRYMSTTTQSITPSQNTVSYSTLNSDTQSKLGISFKNRIINGAMVIDQRNAGASVTNTAGPDFICDRFMIQSTATSKLTGQQVTTAPVGFNYSTKITSLAATSLAAGDFYIYSQGIEGYNLADLNWGTANAKTVTLSFWVQSSLTGTFGGSLDGVGAGSYPFSYTISSANTWEQKSITIAGPTSGTFGSTNGVGIYVRFGLGVGSTYSGTAGSWSATRYFSATGATSVVGTSGATFYLTGVQLEVGTQATTFDYRSYGTELQLCQRYYEKSFNIGTAPANGTTSPDRRQLVCFSSVDAAYQEPFQVSKRADPTLTLYKDANAGTNGQWSYYTGSAWTTMTTVGTRVTSQEYRIDFTVSGRSFGQAVIGGGNWTADAEL